MVAIDLESLSDEPIDWYTPRILDLVQIESDSLSKVAHNAKELLEREVKRLEEETEWPEIQGIDDPEEQFRLENHIRNSEIATLEGTLKLVLGSSILSVTVSFLEVSLLRLCKWGGRTWNGLAVPKNTSHRKLIEHYAWFLAQERGLFDLRTKEFWDNWTNLVTVRNKVVHEWENWTNIQKALDIVSSALNLGPHEVQIDSAFEYSLLQVEPVTHQVKEVCEEFRTLMN